MKKYYLFSEGVYYGMPLLAGEKTVMTTTKQGEASIYLEKEVEYAIDSLRQKGISVSKIEVNTVPSKIGRPKTLT